MVEEIDAGELERRCSREDRENAIEVGRQGDGDGPQITAAPQPEKTTLPAPSPHEKAKKSSGCVIA